MISGSSSIGSFTGFKAHEFVAHASKTNCVAIGPRSGQVLATGGDDKRVNVWRIGRASSIWSLTGNSSAIESLRFDPTEGFLVSGSAGGAVKLFDLSAGKMTRHFRGHMSNVTVIDCGSFDRRFVTTGSMDCQVKLWNVDTKECAMAFKGHNAEVTDVQFSPDGHILASAAADGQVKLWDLRAGKPMHTFQACSGSVRAIRFNPQEFLLAAATSDRTVKLYDIEFMELFCTTAPDTCPIRAITFDPDGQNMYCASPSGLRRWSWDNDTASARLEAMGDVPWGKVCAGALHYNADGRQLLASSCAGSRLSVWAVDFDEGAPRPSRPQQPKQQEAEAAFEPDAAAVVSAPLASTPTAAFAAAGSPATSQPNTPGGGITATPATPADSSISPGGHESADAKIASSRSTSKDRIEEQASRGENSHERGSKQETKSKESSEEPMSVGNSGPPTFQVLGRQLPLLPTAAEVKDPPARPKGAEAATERATTPSTTVEGTRLTSQPAAAVVASLSAVAISGRGGGGNAFRNRRSSRAEAVAAAVAAVASAKAATDDAVASVSSSGRHRSIGTSISDTLVITAHPGGGGGGCGVGEAGAAIDGPDDRGGGNRGGQQQHRPVAAAWAEQAPGKEDGSSGVDRGRGVAAALGVMAAGDRYRLGDERHTAARKNDSERKWHKRVTGAFAGAEEAADDVKSGARVVESGDGRSGRGDGSNSWAMGVAEEKEAKLPSRRDEKAPTSETDEVLGATPLFTVNPWSRRSRNGGAAEADQESRGRGGGDSPPLLGSPEPSRADAVANATAQAVPAATAVVVPSASPPLPDGSNPQFMPSTSRRSPVTSRQREKTDAIVARSSTVGFPIATGDADRPSHSSAVDPSPDCASADGRNTDDQEDTAAAEGLRVGGMLAGGGGGGGGELGMTRPRTATRRWDRPGPPGDDEVIAKTLLSRAAVTSTLSNRLTHLRMLRSGWADGDISGTILRLARLESAVTPADDSPRAVVADFLWVVPLEGARVTLEHCLELMPLLEGLWKLDADGCVAAATRCLESIVRRFGGFVRDTLGAPVAAGRVDLAREDRIARCREAHRAFIRGYHHLERSEGEFYEDRRIAAVAERLRPLFESYFMS